MDFARPVSALFDRKLGPARVTPDPFGGAAAALSPWGTIPSPIRLGAAVGYPIVIGQTSVGTALDYPSTSTLASSCPVYLCGFYLPFDTNVTTIKLLLLGNVSCTADSFGVYEFGIYNSSFTKMWGQTSTTRFPVTVNTVTTINISGGLPTTLSLASGTYYVAHTAFGSAVAGSAGFSVGLQKAYTAVGIPGASYYVAVGSNSPLPTTLSPTDMFGGSTTGQTGFNFQIVLP